MKAKLWKIHFQSPHYSSDWEDVTVNAPNAKCAIDKACKIVDIWRLKTNLSKIRAVETIDLIGKAEN